MKDTSCKCMGCNIPYLTEHPNTPLAPCESLATQEDGLCDQCRELLNFYKEQV